MVAAVSEADELISLSVDRAAELAGVSLHRVSYWQQIGLVMPSIQRKLGASRRNLRLYDFRELLALLIVAELRERGMTLQSIGKVVAHLRRRGYEWPLTELAFAVAGDHIYFQHPDGGWEYDGAPDQHVIHQVLDLDKLKVRIRSARNRSAGAVGKIERRRGTHGGKPVIAGTRVPVATVERYLAAGRSPEQVVESFPVLSTEDVVAVRDQLAG